MLQSHQSLLEKLDPADPVQNIERYLYSVWC